MLERCAEQTGIRIRANYHGLKADDFKEWKAGLARYKANLGPVQKAEIAKKSRTAVMATRKYACEICNVNFTDSCELNIHKTYKKYLDTAAGTYKVNKNVLAQKFHCKTCDQSLRDAPKLEHHQTTQKHIDKVAAAAKSMKSSP